MVVRRSQEVRDGWRRATAAYAHGPDAAHWLAGRDHHTNLIVDKSSPGWHRKPRRAGRVGLAADVDDVFRLGPAWQRENAEPRTAVGARI
jgi:hypothetical protein